MSDFTRIAWTRSTINPWIGCTKIGPGCDNCYAESLDSRYQWGGATHWGPGKPRWKTGPSTWAKPLMWNKHAAWEREHGKVINQHAATWDKPGFWPVFCASLADVFDNEAPNEWRDQLWDVIEQTPNLSWLLVTKRVGNVRQMVPLAWTQNGFPKNVRLMITVVNPDEAYRDLPRLLALPCRNGVSYEPALASVNWEPWLTPIAVVSPDPHGRDRAIEWLIIGGESTQGAGKARPFDIQWARDTIAQCHAAGTAVFMKQLGSAPFEEGCESGLVWRGRNPASLQRIKDRAGANPAEWPDDLRVRQWP